MARSSNAVDLECNKSASLTESSHGFHGAVVSYQQSAISNQRLLMADC